jgi:hypothetical protein
MQMPDYPQSISSKWRICCTRFHCIITRRSKKGLANVHDTDVDTMPNLTLTLDGVTHAVRAIEYRDRNPQYEWFLTNIIKSQMKNVKDVLLVKI